jgi:8-oxo-dGTP pyrophosphatase MutT (NUDIX family)
MAEKLHIKHRETARVLLYSPKKSFLLLKTHFDPEVGLPPRWLTPGGGIDAGETAKMAAIRELSEETGLQIVESDIADPVLVTSGRWDWADGKSFHTYTDTIFELQVEEFEPNTSGFTQDEYRDVLEYRWWKLNDLLASNELLGPHQLKNYIQERFQ